MTCTYMLKAGKVKISRLTPDGKEIILTILGPGEISGELGITGQQEPHGDTAKLTATSRQTVTTQIDKHEKKDLTEYDRKRIYVKDLRHL